MIVEVDSPERLRELDLPLHCSTDRALVKKDGKFFLFVRNYEETSFAWNLKLLRYKIFLRAKIFRDLDFKNSGLQ